VSKATVTSTDTLSKTKTLYFISTMDAYLFSHEAIVMEVLQLKKKITFPTRILAISDPFRLAIDFDTFC
jgi:hypothetical protein